MPKGKPKKINNPETARRVKLAAAALEGMAPATRTVKISDKTAQRLKIAAGALNCTQQEVVERAIELLWPEVSKRLASLD
ncbi:MAG: hypothetical protein M5U25_09500 [Planctomycetota bacterium]|nr:hypothetical protein [Planctomycetota bacterium]